MCLNTLRVCLDRALTKGGGGFFTGAEKGRTLEGVVLAPSAAGKENTGGGLLSTAGDWIPGRTFVLQQQRKSSVQS